MPSASASTGQTRPSRAAILGLKIRSRTSTDLSEAQECEHSRHPYAVRTRDDGRILAPVETLKFALARRDYPQESLSLGRHLGSGCARIHPIGMRTAARLCAHSSSTNDGHSRNGGRCSLLQVAYGFGRSSPSWFGSRSRSGPPGFAARKGHSFILYFLFSLVFFPAALIVAYLVSDKAAPATA